MDAGQAGYIFGEILSIAIITLVIAMAIKGAMKREREKQKKKGEK